MRPTTDKWKENQLDGATTVEASTMAQLFRKQDIIGIKRAALLVIVTKKCDKLAWTDTQEGIMSLI